MDGASGAAGAAAELVDVVDEHDRVVATVSRRRMRRTAPSSRVFVAVTSSEGLLLVHRRSDAKDLWPGRWDTVVGGVVGAGESWSDAARRELAEEVGVDAVPQPVDARTYPYEDDDVTLLARCYRAVHDGPISFPDGEVAEARWVDRAGLDALLTTELFIPDSRHLLPDDVLFRDW